MFQDIVVQVEEVKLKISGAVLTDMHKYIQSVEPISVESGGILIGKENKLDSNLIITNLTVPMLDDVQSYRSYLRKDRGHSLFFQSAYEKSAGTLRYMGEWHTHPEEDPTCSDTDRRNWKRIIKAMPCNMNCYNIIVGTTAIKIWKCYRNKNEISLIGKVLWSAI